MRSNRFTFLVVALLSLPAAVGEARAARVLNQYDLDSLCALAQLVVRVEVGAMEDVETRDGKCAVTDVRILSVLRGDAGEGSSIRVAGVEEYRKGPGIDGVAPRRFPRLQPGDIVYLFLVPKGTPIGYAKYDLTDADWKVIESGARLVVNDRVLGFRQYFPPGPSKGAIPGFVAATPEAFPHAPAAEAPADFENRVRGSGEFVDGLKQKAADGTLTDAERQRILRSRKAVLKREQAAPDYIPLMLERSTTRPTTRPTTRRR